MASSKLPLDFFDPPESLVELSTLYQIHCNIRPDKREELKEVKRRGDKQEILTEIIIHAGLDHFWSMPIHPFLRTIENKTRVVMLIQGVTSENLCTLVADIEIYWTNDVIDEYPRIDFEKPEALSDMLCNVWGGYIVAIAPVLPDTEISGDTVKNEELFITIVKNSGYKVKET